MYQKLEKKKIVQMNLPRPVIQREIRFRNPRYLNGNNDIIMNSEQKDQFIQNVLSKLPEKEYRINNITYGGKVAAINRFKQMYNKKWELSVEPFNNYLELLCYCLTGLTRITELPPQISTMYLNNIHGVIWPPDDGANPGTKEEILLEKNHIVDRYGGIGGRYMGEPLSETARRILPIDEASYRALSSLPKEYHRYRVLKPFPVTKATASPWFTGIGGATQYETKLSISKLIEDGYLTEVPPVIK